MTFPGAVPGRRRPDDPITASAVTVPAVPLPVRLPAVPVPAVPVPAVTVPAVGAGDDDDDRLLLEITYDVAMATLSRIISPSLADFLA